MEPRTGVPYAAINEINMQLPGLQALSLQTRQNCEYYIEFTLNKANSSIMQAQHYSWWGGTGVPLATI